MADWTLERIAGASALAAAACGLAYSAVFVAADSDIGEGTFLLLGGLLALPVFVALYERVRGVDAGFALLALALGAAGAYGATVHGGWQLANGINRPELVPDVPNAADPRGLATFGLTALAVLLFAWLARRARALPDWLTAVGFALGILLVLVYLARLIVLDPDDPVVVVPAVLAGLLANPAWYLGLGRVLLRPR
jgi:hypothetical protein